MAYTINTPAEAGFSPIASTDAGVTFINASSVAPTPPNALGRIVQAVDPTYGAGEFIMLAGVASTAVGTPVIYDSTTWLTTLAPVGTNIPQPIAIAMSANVSASTFGWYQISGLATVVKSSGSLVLGAAVGIATIGTFSASATGIEIEGAVVAATATVTATSMQLIINRPHYQGRIT